VLLKSRIGLIVQAVGENPDAASAMGLPVLRVRTLAVLFGGAMAAWRAATCRWPTRRCGRKT
jgi:simple sugar transport system permease protein